jgi:hypothetical protein
LKILGIRVSVNPFVAHLFGEYPNFEYVEFAFVPIWVGATVSFYIEWEGDRWIQTGTFPDKALGIGENNTGSYEVWKRIE